jgi:hypothetical protein
MNQVTDFPYNTGAALQFILWGTLGGLACALAGIGIQYLINRYLASQGTAEVVELA